MIKVAPAGQKDAVEMRKVYAGFVAQQIEARSPIIALEADLMSSMAMDGVAREHPQPGKGFRTRRRRERPAVGIAAVRKRA